MELNRRYRLILRELRKTPEDRQEIIHKIIDILKEIKHFIRDKKNEED
jgi:hypothetical protein